MTVPAVVSIARAIVFESDKIFSKKVAGKEKWCTFAIIYELGESGREHGGQQNMMCNLMNVELTGKKI